MNVMVPLPDEFAARYGSGPEVGRRVLEVLALDEYRARRMTRAELRLLLGFGTRGELDGFLKDHGVDDGISVDAFDRQMQDLDRVDF